MTSDQLIFALNRKCYSVYSAVMAIKMLSVESKTLLKDEYEKHPDGRWHDNLLGAVSYLNYYKWSFKDLSDIKHVHKMTKRLDRR